MPLTTSRYTPALAGALRCCVLGRPFTEGVPGDVAGFVKACQLEGLLGGLMAQLGQDETNRGLRQEAHALYREEFFSWARYQSWLDELHAVFARAGVQVLLLKGAALRLTVLPEPGLRRMSDVDLFVRGQDAEPVKQALRAHGLLTSAEGCSWTDGDRGLDLHIGTTGAFEQCWGFTEGRLWAASEPMRHRPAFRVLPAELQLEYVGIHALKHSFHRLMWLLDLHRLEGALPAGARPSRPVRAGLFLLGEALGEPRRDLGLSRFEQRLLRSMLRADQRPLGQLLLAAYLPSWGSRLRYLRQVAAERQQPLGRWIVRLLRQTLVGLRLLIQKVDNR